MRSFRAVRAASPFSTPIHPALTSLADECCGILARLIAYLGALALLAIVGVHFWNQWLAGEATGHGAKPGWSVAGRSRPAFAVSLFDLREKTETYEVFRHPEGGRKDVIRWTARDGKNGEGPVAELEIYRPGAESGQAGSPLADIAARMAPEGGRELEAAGVIDSKFGMVTLLRQSGDAGSCLGFIKRIDDPPMRIAGWSCQGDALPARRAAIGCMLNRLVLLTAGNDPKLAELFARAELRRGNCAAVTPSADWVTSADSPLLRGAL